MKQIRRLLLRVLLFPVFMGFGAEGEAVESETPLPESVVSDIPKPEGITDAEWEGLTEEEREALHITDEQVEEESGEVSEEDLDAVIGEDGEETAGDDEEGTEEGTENEGTDETTETLSDADFLAFRPQVSVKDLEIPEVKVPEELQGKLNALDEKLSALDQAFEDGDKTMAEYRREEREIQRERDQINRDANEALFNARQEARDNARMKAEQDQIEAAFHRARPEYGEQVDGKFTEKAEMLYGALEKMFVKVSQDHPTKTFAQKLLMADSKVKEAFGIKPKAKENKEITPANVPRAPQTRPKAKTLANTPTAEGNEDSAYASIMKLTGQAYEDALARMTPKQYEAFSKWNAGR